MTADLSVLLGQAKEGHATLIAKSRRQANARLEGTSDRPNLLDLADALERADRRLAALAEVAAAADELERATPSFDADLEWRIAHGIYHEARARLRLALAGEEEA